MSGVAQADSTSQRARDARPHGVARGWQILAGAAAVGMAADESMSGFARRHQTAGLDRAARAVDPFGKAHFIVPALAASVVLPRVAGKRALSDAMLRVALDYAAADGVESVLKPLVGRHRPQDGRGPWRFHPMSNKEQWHSFPSAHTVHSFALATGLALESGNRWVAVPSYTVASLVGLQRVYTGAHWTSDVLGSAALAVGVAGAADALLRRRGLGPLLRPATRSLRAAGSDDAPGEHRDQRDLQLGLTARSISISWSF